MIDKKPPRFSKASTPAESFDDDIDDIDDVPEAVEDDVDPVDDIDPQAEADAVLAAQKRRANMVTYGGGTLAFIVIVAFGYPKFKHFFVAEKPAITENMATPVPPAARKNYFAGSDKTLTVPTPEVNDNSLGSPGVPAPVNNSVASATDMAQPSVPLPIPAVPSASSVPDTASVQPAAPVQSPAPAAPGTADPSAVASSSTTGSAPVAAPTLPVPPVPPTAASDAQAGVSPQASNVATAPGAATAPSVDVASKLGVLNDRLDKMTAAHAADQAQIQALQANLASMQKQLADVATVKPEGQSVPVRTHHARIRQESVGSGPWELRSATNEMALIGHPGKNDLKKIVPGDVVSGLGKITSIDEQDGGWVVHGTSGSIKQ